MDKNVQPHQYSSNFSLNYLGVACKSGTGFGYAWCPHALSEGPKLRYLLEDKTDGASCRRRAGTVVSRAAIFGDLITADHKILSEESESRNNDRYAVVVQDLGTQWLARGMVFPRQVKNRQRRTREGPEPACVQTPLLPGGTRRG